MYNNFSGYPPATNQYPYTSINNGYFNGSMNGGMQNMNTGGQVAQHYEIVKVNGENGARSFRMAPNSQCILLDETAPIVWLCQSDGAGYHTVSPYTITPYQSKQEPDFTTLESRIERLEKLYESNVTNVKSSNETTTGATAGE